MSTWFDLVGLRSTEYEPELTRVKYTFNRGLTWSEREAFREYFSQMEEYVEHKFDREDPAIVTLEVIDTDSRDLTVYVSAFAEGLLNVHPVSAHTLQPTIKV